MQSIAAKHFWSRFKFRGLECDTQAGKFIMIPGANKYDDDLQIEMCDLGMFCILNIDTKLMSVFTLTDNGWPIYTRDDMILFIVNADGIVKVPSSSALWTIDECDEEYYATKGLLLNLKTFRKCYNFIGSNNSLYKVLKNCETFSSLSTVITEQVYQLAKFMDSLKYFLINLLQKVNYIRHHFLKDRSPLKIDNTTMSFLSKFCKTNHYEFWKNNHVLDATYSSILLRESERILPYDLVKIIKIFIDPMEIDIRPRWQPYYELCHVLTILQAEYCRRMHRHLGVCKILLSESEQDLSSESSSASSSLFILWEQLISEVEEEEEEEEEESSSSQLLEEEEEDEEESSSSQLLEEEEEEESGNC